MENALSAITEIDRRKGAALRKKMRANEVRQEDLAAKIDYRSRQQISKWWKGEYWPTDLEGKLEKALDLPNGFFARVGEGIDYETALKDCCAGLILISVPAMEMQTQIVKMGELLAYLTARKIVSSWTELEQELRVQEGYLADCALGHRALHPTLMEVIAHRWDIQEAFWTDAQAGPIDSYVGRRTSRRKREEHERQDMNKSRVIEETKKHLRNTLEFLDGLSPVTQKFVKAFEESDPPEKRRK